MSKLWAHQQQIIDFMLGREYGLVWAGMRSGKTRSALETIHQGGFRRTLVVTKKKAIKVWGHEWDKHGYEDKGLYVWAGYENMSVAAYTKELSEVLRIQEDNENFQLVVVLNYDRVWREPLFSILLGAGFDLMILDESHKAKANNGSTSNALFELSKFIPRRFLMTGTPMPNGPMDMYGQLRILHPMLVKVHPTRNGFGVYREHYCYLKPVRGAGPGVFQIDGYKNMEQFNEVLAGVTLRIDTSKVLDLPASIETDRFVTLSTKAQTLYKTFKKEAIADLKAGVITASNILVKTLRLQQLAGGFLKPDKSNEYEQVDDAKLTELLDILDELEAGEPVIIVAKYTAEIEAISDALISEGYTVALLTGKHDTLQEWQDGKRQILVMQISTGAEGLSLVRSKRMIFYSVDYSLGVFDQVKARISGPEQTAKTVFYDYIKAKDTIDSVIYGALQNKQDVNSAVLSAISEASHDRRNAA